MKSKYLLKLNLQTFAAGTKTLEELQQERAAIHDKQEALVVKAQTENRGFNSEEETEYNNLEEQFLNLNAEIEKMEQQATLSIKRLIVLRLLTLLQNHSGHLLLQVLLSSPSN